MKIWNAFLLFLALAAGMAIGMAIDLAHRNNPMPSVITVRTDTIHHFERMPVPYPIPGQDRIIHAQSRDTTMVYVTRQIRDTVYADCDSARRYTLTHADSNGAITYSADICGRLLHHELAYTAYRRTITERIPDPGHSYQGTLYASVNTLGALGLQGTCGRWLVGYAYAPWAQGWERHQVMAGIRILPLTKKHKSR